MYNNNIFNTLFICIVLLFVSCTSANENEDFIAPFRSISGVLINDNDSSILIGSRSSISGVINNAVYIFDPWGEYFFSKYDANKNEFYRFCKRGQGPNESINVLSSVALISKDSLNYISIFDNYYCKFKLFAEKDVTNNDYIQEFPIFEWSMIAEAFPINDSIAIVRGVFGENILMFLQNGVNRGVYLEPFTKKGDDNVKRAIKDGNKFSISPNKKHIARITQNGGLIESYKIEDMELIKLFSHNYFEVICDNQLSDTKDSRYGYIDVSVSNNKIYALYDGGLVNRENSFCSNVIHVYSFDGELLEKLFLDFFVDSANVDCNDTIIFAKSSENNDLLSFKL